MALLWKRRQKRQVSPDLSPVVDPAGQTPITISLINYNQEIFDELQDIDAADAQPYLSQQDSFTWIHVQGQPRPSELREIGEILSLHPLALEDVFSIGERSKTETYDEQVLVILGMPTKRGDRIINEQVSLFLGKNFLVSFHNGDSDPFKAVRRRMNHPQAALRRHAVDYLLYVLVDVVIDHGFPILDEFEQEIQDVEANLMGTDGIEHTLMRLYTIKRELLVLRLKLRPQREAVHALMRDDNDLLQKETKIYLRDCYDHTIRLIDIIEIYRDMTTNMLDVYLSLVNKVTYYSNEIQRKATVWAMIFAPLTFVTGIYGMNFAIMPETQLNYGFYGLIAMMGLVGFIMWLGFKRFKWL